MNVLLWILFLFHLRASLLPLQTHDDECHCSNHLSFIFMRRCCCYDHPKKNVISCYACYNLYSFGQLYSISPATVFLLAIMVINTFLFHSVHIFCHQSPRKLKNTVCSVGNNVYLLHTYFCVNTKYVYRSGLKMFLFWISLIRASHNTCCLLGTPCSCVWLLTFWFQIKVVLVF